jgi:hypothetical protein
MQATQAAKTCDISICFTEILSAKLVRRLPQVTLAVA